MRDHTWPTTSSRPFRDERDFWRIRNLIIDTFPIVPFDFNWDLRRWDGYRFHREDPTLEPLWSQQVRLWETADGQLVGAVHPEDGGDAWLELHPDYRESLEEEMVAWAEGHLARPNQNGRRQLLIFVYEYDSPRRRLLERRGYEKLERGGMARRLRLGQRPLPRAVMPEGYAICTTAPGNEEHCQRMANLLNAAFDRDLHTAREYSVFTTQSPSFRHDLNLVAEAPDGLWAAHVGVTYNDVNKQGIYEPVCTHPKHRRKGLAQALMLDGLQRLRDLGATEAYVGTGDAGGANHLYEAVGFTEAYKGYLWLKVLPLP